MGQLIANSSCTIEITPKSPQGIEPGSPTYKFIQVEKVSIGDPVLVNNITWQMNTDPEQACVFSGYEFKSGASITPISYTTAKVKCNNQSVLRVGDSGQCAGLFTNNSGSQICQCDFKITDAGQSTVEAE